MTTIHMQSDEATAHRLRLPLDGLAAQVQQRESLHLEQLGVVFGQAIDLPYLTSRRPGSPGGEEAGTLRNIRAYYQSVPSGRMIVAGDTGTGKTVLAIHLALDLPRDRGGDPLSVQPVPVMLNASGWNTETAFSHWLVTQLRTGYDVPPGVARALVEGGHLLPLLDGLDEMDPPDSAFRRARAALGQLNEAPWRDQPVIVMCRAEVFRQILQSPGAAPGAGLHAAAVINLSLLDADQARAYLLGRREAGGASPGAWAPVIDGLATRPSSPLARTLAQPWALNLVVGQLSRGGRGAARKIASSRSARKLETLLFAGQVPSAVAAHPAAANGRTYTVEQAHYWLRGLALHLAAQRTEGRGGTAIALHELWRIAGPKLRPSAKFITIPALLSLAILTTVRPALDLAGGLALGLGYGVWAGAAVTMVLPGPRRLVLRVRRRRTLWRRIWLGVMAGLSGFTTAGLVVGLIVRATLGFPAGVRAGLVAGATALFYFGPTVFLAGDRRSQPDASRAIRDDWTAGLIMGLAAGASAGFAAWLAFRLTAGITAGHTARIQLGLLAAVGIAAGGTAGGWLSLAWTSVRYRRACRLLRKSGFFDGQPAPFLDWARTAGLLRVAGGAYQFRYEGYPQWLVAHPHPVEGT